MENSISPVSLRGGIFLQSKTHEQSLHLDKSHIWAMRDELGVKTESMGILEPWITAGVMGDTGSWLRYSQGEIKEVDGEIYTYKVNLPVESVYIVEDLSNTDKPGIDGQVFRLRLNRRAFGNTAVVKFQLSDDFDLYVTEDEIIKDGAGTGATFIYTFKVISDRKGMYCPKSRLTANNRIAYMSSMDSEYNTVYDDLSMSTQTAEYFNYVGNSRANKYFTVSEDAATMSVPEQNIISINDFRKNIEMHIFKPGTAGFDAQLKGAMNIGQIKDYANYDKGMGAGYEKFKQDLVSSSWIPQVELMYAKHLELEVHNQAMWSGGGTIMQDRTQVRLPIGLYQQYNNGNKHFYSINTLKHEALSYIEGIITSYQRNRQAAFDDKHVLEVRVGAGAFSILLPALKAQPQQQGMVVNADRFISGENGALKFDTPIYNMYKTIYGWIKFIVDPALDPVDADDISNPMIGGFRLSAYMIIVDDFMGTKDNVVTLRRKGQWDTKHSFTNGKSDYFGKLHNFGGNQRLPFGFEVVMKKSHVALWLKDPTRSLMIKPYNPYTGKPFGETDY
jgi:hypothetical protein